LLCKFLLTSISQMQSFSNTSFNFSKASTKYSIAVYSTPSTNASIVREILDSMGVLFPGNARLPLTTKNLTQLFKYILIYAEPRRKGSKKNVVAVNSLLWANNRARGHGKYYKLRIREDCALRPTFSHAGKRSDRG